MQHLENLAEQERTIILYESPHRVNKTLQEIFKVFGDRKIAIARELTKIHEEVIRGSLAELVAMIGNRKWRGERVINDIDGQPLKTDKLNDEEKLHAILHWSA